MIESVAESCHSLVKKFLERIVPKYSDGLGSGASRSSLVRAGKRLQWAVREKGQLRAVKDKLGAATTTLTMLMLLATQ